MLRGHASLSEDLGAKLGRVKNVSSIFAGHSLDPGFVREGRLDAVDALKPAVLVVEHTFNGIIKLANLGLGVLVVDRGELEDVHSDECAQLLEDGLHVLVSCTNVRVHFHAAVLKDIVESVNLLQIRRFVGAVEDAVHDQDVFVNLVGSLALLWVLERVGE